MIERGRAAWVYPDDFDADDIVGVENMTVQDPRRLREATMAAYAERFSEEVRPGDILVAGRNFGFGHVHDQPMWAMRDMGITLVIAESFAPFFARSEKYSGMRLLSCPGIGSAVSRWDEISVDWDTRIVCDETTGQRFQAEPWSSYDAALAETGGGAELLHERFERLRAAVPLPGRAAHENEKGTR